MVSSRSRWQQETCDGLLSEYGIIAPHGIAHLRRLLSELLADPEGSGLSGLLGETLVEIAGRLRFFDERIRTYDLRIGRVFAHDERCQRLAKVEGVGPLVATAMVAAVGNAREFKSGRELSAWLGLVPRQHSSGNRNVLLGISKRGDRYLRTLLIHGARSALCRVERRRDRRSTAVRSGGLAGSECLSSNRAVQRDPATPRPSASTTFTVSASELAGSAGLQP